MVKPRLCSIWSVDVDESSALRLQWVAGHVLIWPNLAQLSHMQCHASVASSLYMHKGLLLWLSPCPSAALSQALLHFLMSLLYLCLGLSSPGAFNDSEVYFYFYFYFSHRFLGVLQCAAPHLFLWLMHDLLEDICLW